MNGRTFLRFNSSLVGLVAVVLVGCGPGGGGGEETGTSAGEGTTVGSEESGSTGVPTSSGGTSSEATSAETSAGSTDATSSEGTDTSEGTTGPMMCTAPPLTDEQLNALAFGVFGNEFEAQPGDVRMLKLGVVECCYFLEEVDACVKYSLSPEEGASYDPVTGVFEIDEGVAAGTVFTLTADVEDGRAIVEATITVYTPESNPLVGIWHEVAQAPCMGGGDVEPMPPIGELWFKANGDVMVTWSPFEVYVDYWGSYTFDLQSGALMLAIDGGNYVPPDIDGDGSFAVEAEQLVLSDMWLGSAQDFMGEPACGHRFER